MPTPKPDTVLRCSFCGKPDQDVDDLVAGPDCYICDVCIGLACEIIQAAKARRQAKESPPPTEKSEKDKTHE